MRRLNATRVGAILAVWALTAAGCTYSGQADVSSRRTGVIPYSEPDLVNPLRGQYQNLATELFPQASPAQREYQPWPGTTDVSLRLDWRTLQPRDPRKLPRDARDDVRYDFSVLDRALASAHANGRRVGFRVTAFNSCCETSYPKGIDISVPDWLLTIPGTTRTYPHGGVKYVIPDWNHPAYLSHFADLLAALGRRYDRDERLAMVEMSGYGDFSENHVAFMRDTLGRPAPSPERSQAELGYFSQYRDQYITKKAITFLVNANLRAFPNTALVTAAGNPEITKQLFRDNPLLRARRKPVGIRADGLGKFDPIPTWVANEYSRYVQIQDPIINVVLNRYRTAPVITEWIPDPPQAGAMDYYLTGLRDVVNRHVSMTASTGFPGQLNDIPMPADQYRVWANANKFSGYRYSVTAEQPAEPIPASERFALKLRWTNFGSAPVYERWQVRYDIVSTSGQVVRTIDSRMDLRTLVADQKFEDVAGQPTAATTVDTVALSPGLPAGRYTVRATVGWREHKPNASVSVDFPPMQLAQYGRDDDGGYPVTEFSVQ
ncbi:hypothetical protein BN970_01778 [Mycolicibacterium conceptionense]|uniref:DUF4832 domain-containing protein n=2 Tax=Mycolicibacterium conceptionense TaxID=451644 RepID=A0A0U1D8Y5_9MYCO|nr:DUF4832 domain-containing protein [Mycolicibacterium conceptionense]CQD09147.1 hypothetical protein BN970_01778 [Mycolicibacterium conceptionense]